jgi:hypothetical protein
MTEEIERMMTELTALCNKGNSLPTTRPSAPATTTVLPKLLLKAKTMQAHSEYTGPDWKYLLIMPGDIIIAYAYINEVTAVGFNTRTNLGGRFPIDTAKKVEPRPHEKAEIFFATLEYAGGKRIYGGPTALIKVLSTWVGFVSLMISRRLCGKRNLKTFIKLDRVCLIQRARLFSSCLP